MLRKSWLPHAFFLSKKAGQKALAQRAERHKAGVQLFRERQQVFFGIPPEHGILALDSGQGHSGVRAADCVHARLRKIPMPALALPHQFRDGSGQILNGHVRINAMLVVKINDIHAQAFERSFHGRADLLGSAVLDLAAVATADAERGGNHRLITEGRERFAQQCFIGMGTVDFGDIEKGDAAIKGRAVQGDHSSLAGSGP